MTLKDGFQQAHMLESSKILHGNWVALSPLETANLDALLEVVISPEVISAPWWEYLHTPPIRDRKTFDSIISSRIGIKDALFYAISDTEAESEMSQPSAIGWTCLTDIALKSRTADIGIFLPGPASQKTPRATEATYLLLRHAFNELELRRIYWKTDALNVASCRAAKRLGFVLDRVIEGAAVVEGKSRDMAIYVLAREEWLGVAPAIETWLSAGNFDERVIQIRKLADIGTSH